MKTDLKRIVEGFIFLLLVEGSWLLLPLINDSGLNFGLR